ncbi:MAG TPA: TIGR03067 domain-containing protein [Gemmataceae bacterium]|jgi:uncharacterized protein (TIGR03067 family)
MKRYVFGLFAFAAAAGAACSVNAADTDEEMLQGEWILSSIEIQGKTLPAPLGKGGSIIFAKDGKLVMKDPGKTDRNGTYKIDASKNPKQIDLTVSREGEAVHGIYELDGEKLKMAFSSDGPKGHRPSDFKGENVMIVLWKRQKT